MELLFGGIGILIGVTIGIFIGLFVGIERVRKSIENSWIGWLRIDHSEPDEPTRMFTELKNVTPDIIGERYKFVTFQVINEDYLSRK